MADVELFGDETLSNTPKRTQVYMATHDGEGNRLPQSERSFISFSFGGVDIEDFNFIATINGDRMSKSLFGGFENITTDYKPVDGRFYWGTHFLNNQLTFNLSTDEISEHDFEIFKNWFGPGIMRELILAEHPNRAIMARVEPSPTMSMLPFEKEVSKVIIEDSIEYTYTTSTTVYRGDVNLVLTMDEPFWYSKVNVFDTLDSEKFKIMLEDGIPKLSMFGQNDPYYGEADTYKSLTSSATQKLYYCGSAASKPILSLKITPTLNEDGYISYPNNSITSPDTPYNYIQVGDKKFLFTTPGMWSGYNQAMQLVDNFEEGEAIEELYEALRDNVYEYFSRAWALYCLNEVAETAIQMTSTIKENFKEKMQDFIYTDLPAVFTFNSKTGESIGTLHCKITDSLATSSTGIVNYSLVEIAEVGNGLSNDEIGEKNYSVKENVGDMVCSDYLLIENNDLKNALKLKNNSYILNYLQVSADCTLDASIEYKYMYL